MIKLDTIKIKDSNEYKTLLDVIYPIGSVYFSADESNPAILFGGTWVRYDGGLIAANNTFTGYAAVGETGGTNSISIANLPAHTHTGPSHTHTVSGTAASAGAHSHKGSGGSWILLASGSTVSGLNATWGNGNINTSLRTTDSSGAHTHTVTGTAAASGTGNTGSTGSGNAYIPYHHSFAVYKRTA